MSLLMSFCMREDRPGAFSADPDQCICDAGRVGINTLCSLAGVWVNCRRMGCYTMSDGSYAKPDNSPEACARRLEMMKEERT